MGFVGTWNTTWTGVNQGAGLMTINSDGTGSYSPDGTLQGTFGDGNLSYSGTWSEPNGTGTFTYVLVGTQTFIGVWSLDSNPAGQWNGTIDLNS